MSKLEIAEELIQRRGIYIIATDFWWYWEPSGALYFEHNYNGKIPLSFGHSLEEATNIIFNKLYP